MTFVEILNRASHAWASRVVGGLIDAAIVLALVAVIWITLQRRTSPAVGCWLFLLVVAKMLLPLEIAVPDRIVAWTPQRWVDNRISGPPPMAKSPTEDRDPFGPIDLPVADREASLGGSSHIGPIAPPPPVPAQPARGGNTVVASSPSSASTATVEDATSATRLETLAWLMLGWAAVVLFLLGRTVRSQWRFGRIVRGAAPVEADRWPFDFAALCRKFGFRRPVAVLEIGRVAMPVVWGLLRPRIVLPERLLRQLPADQLRWVLLHELAHIRRWDAWIAVLQRLVTIVHFFNPFVWLANRKADRLREYACDDLALGLQPVKRAEAGRALLTIAEFAATADRPVADALAAFDFKASLQKRLIRLVDSRRTIRTGVGIGSVCASLLVAAVVLPQLKTEQTPPNNNSQAFAEGSTTLPNTTAPAAPPVRDSSADSRQRAKAEEFLKLFKEGRIKEAVQTSPEFRRTYHVKKELGWIQTGFNERAGAFEEVLSYRNRKFADRTLLEARCRWQRAVMLVRLLFDRQGEVEGFWLARDREGPTPKSFRKGGYVLGIEMNRLAGRSGSIPVRVVATHGGTPATVTVTLRAPLPKGSQKIPHPFVSQGALATRPAKRTFPPYPYSDGYPYVWTDPETGRRWLRLTYYSSHGTWNPYSNHEFEYTPCFRGLRPGEYLVTVRWLDGTARPSARRQLGEVHAKSQVIQLDLSRRPQPITIVVPDE